MNNKRVNNGLTTALYEDDAYAKECDALVLECRECIYQKENQEAAVYGLVLDRTVFFPEGGGQPADEGWLSVPGEECDRISAEGLKENTIRILDVQKQEGIILHYVSEPVPVGTRVKAVLDWKLRYERMQNHSGEHLFCGLVHKLYGYENVGFHMSKDCVIVDVNGVLTAEDMRKLEKLANEGVDANVEIVAVYPDSPEEMSYRSKLELTEDIRVVVIDGYDACACCAPHVHTTGEIGLIKVLDFMSHRGGTRFTLKSGKWAREDYNILHGQIGQIMRRFSAKREECDLAAERVSEQLKSQQETITNLKKQITDLYMGSLKETIEKNAGSRIICFFAGELDEVQLRTLVNEGVAAASGAVAGFVGKDGESYRYIIGKSENEPELHLCEMTKEMNAALGGRGGGSEKMVQGSVSANRKEIEAFFTNYGK